MRYLVSSKSGQSHLRDKLVNEDDYTNSADEATQEGPAQDVIQKAKSEEAANENECASHARDNASNLGIAPAVIVVCSALFDVLTHNFANEERARCFWAYNHLWTGA